MPKTIPVPRASHREQNARDAARLYADGASVRDIAEQLGLSYGGAHSLLRYAGVTMRSRGGDTRSNPRRRSPAS